MKRAILRLILLLQPLGVCQLFDDVIPVTIVAVPKGPVEIIHIRQFLMTTQEDQRSLFGLIEGTLLNVFERGLCDIFLVHLVPLFGIELGPISTGQFISVVAIIVVAG